MRVNRQSLPPRNPKNLRGWILLVLLAYFLLAYALLGFYLFAPLVGLDYSGLSIAQTSIRVWMFGSGFAFLIAQVGILATLLIKIIGIVVAAGIGGFAGAKGVVTIATLITTRLDSATFTQLNNDALLSILVSAAAGVFGGAMTVTAGAAAALKQVRSLKQWQISLLLTGTSSLGLLIGLLHHAL